MPKSSSRVSEFKQLAIALAWAVLAVPAAHAQTLDLQLTVDNRFPVLESTITFTLTGPPDVEFGLRASGGAQEKLLPAWGLVFIDTNDILDMGNGVLDGNGEATIVVNVPNRPELVNKLFHFQARGELDPDRGVSNAITIRIQDAPPSGPRQPAAMVVTPDGTKAYVAHERDATISVIDAVNDVLLDEIPIGPVSTSLGKPISMGIDPEGRHLFIADPRRREIALIHIETGSFAGVIEHAASTNGIAFDFSGPEKMVYFTNTRAQAVLPYEELPDGTFFATGKISVEGQGPGPVITLDDGTLVVANRQSLDVEFVDPVTETTLARTSLESLPLDLVLRDDDLLVPTFVPEPLIDNGDGNNEVLVIDTQTFLVDDSLWQDLGTDYLDIEVSDNLIAATASGSGAVLFADRTSFLFSDLVEIAPGAPTAHNVSVSFVPDSGSGEKVYTINHFRESIRVIDVSAGPPFVLGSEIALAHSGLPRVPFVDLTDTENGDWLFSTVEFFNGTATNPNPVTCNTCHTWYFSAGFNNAEPFQAQPLFDLGNLGPWLYSGQFSDLGQKTNALFNNHGAVGGSLSPAARALMTDFQDTGMTLIPTSPFVVDGQLSADATAGKALFEGIAMCSSCHVEPLFIPVDEADRTIVDGVGTGIAPINVTSLIGLWSTAPYLHDGTAETLLDVLLQNTSDEHGVTSGLTTEELDQIVAYLQSI